MRRGSALAAMAVAALVSAYGGGDGSGANSEASGTTADSKAIAAPAGWNVLDACANFDGWAAIWNAGLHQIYVFFGDGRYITFAMGRMGGDDQKVAAVALAGNFGA